jgi:hypothetical protein
VRGLTGGAACRERQHARLRLASSLPPEHAPGLASATALLPFSKPGERANPPVTVVAQPRSGPTLNRLALRERAKDSTVSNWESRIYGERFLSPNHNFGIASSSTSPTLSPRRFTGRRAFQRRMWRPLWCPSRVLGPRRLTGDPRPWFLADFLDPRCLVFPSPTAPHLSGRLVWCLSVGVSSRRVMPSSSMFAWRYQVCVFISICMPSCNSEVPHLLATAHGTHP